MAKIQSVEPNIADLANGWLRSYKLPYKLEQESLNTEIDQALNDYASKSGGAGGNRPDAKLFLQDKNLVNYPILIEYKGYKDKLVLLDADGRVANKTAKNQPDFKTINSYAVNGAVHYANALLHYTSYTEIIAIGMTGYKDDAGKLQYEIGVYYVSKSNFGVGQKVDDYTDFSFLKKENFDQFIETVKQLHLTPEEIEKLRERREQEINASLVKLNNDIYQNEKGLSERDRVYLVAASIIATLGVPGKVAALEKAELKSSTEDGNRDGDIILRKIKAFLNEKNLPSEKRDLIVRTLQNTLTTDNINKVENGESQLKRVFTKIIDDLGIYYKIGLSTDFTGKLFNEMYSWLGFSQDKLNDVVLTPSYVATLLARLARVNKDSYVWDFATGSAGLLVASMNEMLIDAKEKIKSPDELARKSAQIKATQLLGLEILSEVYMLAILNMILMGDGSSNIINKDSLKEFDGNYGFGKTDEKFPADAFVLNPPYSAPGNGMVFVERALSMMSKGYINEDTKYLNDGNTISFGQDTATVFYQEKPYFTGDKIKILKPKLHEFCKNNAQFFIVAMNLAFRSFSWGSSSFNMEIIKDVKLTLPLTPDGKIDFAFMESFIAELEAERVAELSAYLTVSGLDNYELSEQELKALAELKNVTWGKYKMGDLFEKVKTKKLPYKAKELPTEATGKYTLPCLTSSFKNQGLNYFAPVQGATVLKSVITIPQNSDVYRAYYQSSDFTVLSDAYAIDWKFDKRTLSREQYLFMVMCINKVTDLPIYSYKNKLGGWNVVKDKYILLPQVNGEIDFNYMEDFISAMQKLAIKDVVSFTDRKIAGTKEVIAK